MQKIYASLSVLLTLFSANIYAQTWTAMDGGVNGPAPQVFAMTTYNGSLIVAGSFNLAGNLAGINIASWNGAWDSLAAGLGPADNEVLQVQALAVYNNELYVTGNFDSTGNMPIAGLVKWNGTAWSNIPLTAPANAMAVYNNKLYVGGDFTSYGGVTANNLACWDGTTWTAADSGVLGQGVGSLTVYNNQLIVGGNFYAMGSNITRVNNIAAWNGTSWSQLGTGIGDSGTAGVTGLCVIGDTLYAGGQFATASGIPATNVAAWNGASWSALGTGVGDTSGQQYVICLGEYNGNLVAGGSFGTAGGVAVSNIAEWNRTGWSALGQGVDGYVFALCQLDGNLYAGGAISAAGGVAANNVAEWTAPTGIMEPKTANMVQVYPNPTGNRLIIEGLTPGTLLTINNLLGQTVLTTIVDNSRQSLNVSALSSGMYFVNGTKFVKE